MNLTSPESRIMKTADGFARACNAQAVVDNGSHLIVAAPVSDAVNDKQQIAPALEQLEAAAPAVGRPGAVLADTGYHSAANSALTRTMTSRRSSPKAGRPTTSRLLRLAVPPALPVDADVVAPGRGSVWRRGRAAVYAGRKSTVETVFGVIKELVGFPAL